MHARTTWGEGEEHPADTQPKTHPTDLVLSVLHTPFFSLNAKQLPGLEEERVSKALQRKAACSWSLHPSAAGASLKGGDTPDFPSLAILSLSEPRKKKARGFWRESLGASPDFYGDEEGGVKAFSPSPLSWAAAPFCLPAPRVCQIFQLIISPELQSFAASDSHLSGRAGCMLGGSWEVAWRRASLSLAQERTDCNPPRSPPFSPRPPGDPPTLNRLRSPAVGAR